jgi:hypothetical protein
MNHENQIRASHHRRGLAARQVIKIVTELFPPDDNEVAPTTVRRKRTFLPGLEQPCTFLT